jgi:hypothetical protein
MLEFGPVRGGDDVPRGCRRPSVDAKAFGVPATSSRSALSTAGKRPADTGHAFVGGAFLAHLIVTAEDLRQTREKRRLAPEEASRLYAAAPARMQPRRARLRSP